MFMSDRPFLLLTKTKPFLVMNICSFNFKMQTHSRKIFISMVCNSIYAHHITHAEITHFNSYLGKILLITEVEADYHGPSYWSRLEHKHITSSCWPPWRVGHKTVTLRMDNGPDHLNIYNEHFQKKLKHWKYLNWWFWICFLFSFLPLLSILRWLLL